MCRRKKTKRHDSIDANKANFQIVFCYRCSDALFLRGVSADIKSQDPRLRHYIFKREVRLKCSQD